MPAETRLLDEADPVNPSHYNAKAITPIEVIRACNLGFSTGNAVKYIMRHKEKNGKEDLKKAVWYLLEEIGVPIPEIVQITSKLP